MPKAEYSTISVSGEVHGKLREEVNSTGCHSIDDLLRRQFGLERKWLHDKKEGRLICRGGRPPRWPFCTMALGEEATIGWGDDGDDTHRALCSMYNHAKRTGKQFHTLGGTEGLWVKRIA